MEEEKFDLEKHNKDFWDKVSQCSHEFRSIDTSIGWYFQCQNCFVCKPGGRTEEQTILLKKYKEEDDRIRQTWKK